MLNLYNRKLVFMLKRELGITISWFSYFSNVINMNIRNLTSNYILGIVYCINIMDLRYKEKDKIN